MANPRLLRLAATLMFIGVVVYVGLIIVHPHGAANDQDTFTAFAASPSWVAIHLGQFVGLVGLLAGLLVLYFALDMAEGGARWVGMFAAVAAGVTLALAGVFSAVDGVALKQAVDAWASAPAAERAVRFASAEALQSLEMGAFSYQNLMLGVALVLFATAIIWSVRVARPIGYLMGVVGLAFIVGGWLEGSEGFSATQSIVALFTYFLLLPGLSIALLIVAWRTRVPVTASQAVPGLAGRR